MALRREFDEPEKFGWRPERKRQLIAARIAIRPEVTRKIGRALKFEALDPSRPRDLCLRANGADRKFWEGDGHRIIQSDEAKAATIGGFNLVLKTRCQTDDLNS